MDVFCPQCGGKIPVEDMNLEKLAAKCRACLMLFSLAVIVDEQGNRSRRNPAINKPVRYPHSFRISETPNELRIERRWFSVGKIPFFIVGVLLDGLLGGSYYHALITNQTIEGFPWPLLTMGMSVLLTYKIIQHLINRSEICVGADGVWFADRPVSLEPPSRLRVDEIDQIFCRQVGTGPNQPTSDLESFEVIAIDKAGAHHCMMRNLNEIGHARFIEQRVESYLGISDRWVIEEYLGKW